VYAIYYTKHISIEQECYYIYRVREREEARTQRCSVHPQRDTAEAISPGIRSVPLECRVCKHQRRQRMLRLRRNRTHIRAANARSTAVLCTIFPACTFRFINFPAVSSLSSALRNAASSACRDEISPLPGRIVSVPLLLSARPYRGRAEIKSWRFNSPANVA